MKEVKAYQCGFCRKCFLRTVDAINHERACAMNPQRRACKACMHFGYKTDKLDGYDINSAYCLKLDIPMSDQPYYAECDVAYHPNGEEYPIPGTCEHYEYKRKEVSK